MDGLVREMEDTAARKKALATLIEKRCELVDYLRRIYHGERNLHYLNIAHARPQQVLSSVDENVAQKR